MENPAIKQNLCYNGQIMNILERYHDRVMEGGLLTSEEALRSEVLLEGLSLFRPQPTSYSERVLRSVSDDTRNQIMNQLIGTFGKQGRVDDQAMKELEKQIAMSLLQQGEKEDIRMLVSHVAAHSYLEKLLPMLSDEDRAELIAAEKAGDHELDTDDDHLFIAVATFLRQKYRTP